MTEARNVYRGRVLTVNVEAASLPNGKVAQFEIVRHPGGAAVVAIDDHGRVCLLRQYRHAAGAWLWELPAGRLEAGEAPAATAARELEEEAGVRAERWDELGYLLSSPGVCDEAIHLFLARGLTHVEPNTEEHELLEVHWVPFSSACDFAYGDQITDAKTIVALLRAENRLIRQKFETGD